MIEKICARLEAERKICLEESALISASCIQRIKEIVQEVAKDGGWIPCEVDMPEEHESIFAKRKGTDKWNDAMFEKISDMVNVTVIDTKGMVVTTHAHTLDGRWSCDLLKADKSYRIIAWQPLPAPYQKGEPHGRKALPGVPGI